METLYVTCKIIIYKINDILVKTIHILIDYMNELNSECSLIVEVYFRVAKQ